MFFMKMLQLWYKQICLSCIFSSSSILEQGVLVLLVLSGLPFSCQLVTPGISPTCCICWWFSSWILVGFFYFGCFLYSFSGIKLHFFPVTKEWSALVLTVRVIYHQIDQLLPWSEFSISFKTQFHWGNLGQTHKVWYLLTFKNLYLWKVCTDIFWSFHKKKKQQSQQ